MTETQATQGEEYLGEEWAQRDYSSGLVSSQLIEKLQNMPPDYDLATSGAHRAFFARGANGVQLWAHFCGHAARSLGPTSVEQYLVLATLQLEEVEGVAAKDYPYQPELLTKFRTAVATIDALPESARKARLEELCALQRGAIEEDNGHFCTAANDYLLAAEKAVGEWNRRRDNYLHSRALLLEDLLLGIPQGDDLRFRMEQFCLHTMIFMDRLDPLNPGHAYSLARILTQKAEVDILTHDVCPLPSRHPWLQAEELAKLLPHNYQEQPLFRAWLLVLTATNMELSTRAAKWMCETACDLVGRTGDVAALALFVSWKRLEMSGVPEQEIREVCLELVGQEGKGGHIAKKLAAKWLEAHTPTRGESR